MLRPRVLPFHLQYGQRAINAAAHPLPRAVAEIRQIEIEMKAEAAGVRGMQEIIATPAFAIMAMEGAVTALAQAQAQNDAAVAAIAIERYRREHGKLPADLSELVPNLLVSLPPDPFSGRWLRYLPAAEGYTLYSVGPDGIDNGGQSDDKHRWDDVLRVDYAAEREMK